MKDVPTQAGANLSQVARYTSEDVAFLPCEAGLAARFFFPIEFDLEGNRFPHDQFEAVRAAITRRPDLTHIYIFVHGWNKTPFIAEREYQDFICRLHGRLRQKDLAEGKPSKSNLLIIGVFWRSTFWMNCREPLLLKWCTYFVIRRRADRVAKNAFQQLMRNVGGQIADRGGIRQLNLIGHSFGARMLIVGLQEFLRQEHLSREVILFRKFIGECVTETNLISIAGAIAQREVLQRVEPENPGSLVDVITKEWHGRFFNVFSHHDRATRMLFPVASLFTSDCAQRAIGACPLNGCEIFPLPATGHIVAPRYSKDGMRIEDRHRLLEHQVWNIDASKIIFAHNDIYKGRVATMLHELMGSPSG